MERLSLVHTGDVHLGQSSGAFGSRAAEHRDLLREAFSRVIDHCLERSTDLLIIAGDLFDTDRPALKTSEFAWEQLARLGRAVPSVEAVILPGTHDLLREDSVYAEWLQRGLPSHVHLLSDPAGEPVALADGEVLVHGGPGCLRLSPGEGASFNIGVVHAALQLGSLMNTTEPVLTPQEVADSRVDYLALGHWHRFGDYSTGGVMALYCGSPEILAVDQSEKGQAVRVELTTGGLPRQERFTTGRLRREHEEINLADYDNQAQLAEELRRRADPELILDVNLGGLADPSFRYEAEALAEELAADFFRIRVRDQGVLAQDEITDSRYPPELVVGRFVRMMEQRIEQARDSKDEEQVHVETQALQLGLALLERREVL